MKIIIDTGPLVAFLDHSDHYNYRVGQAFSELKPPFYTCESVITETVFLLQRGKINPDWLFELIERNDIVIEPVLKDKRAMKRIREIINNYNNLPASLADASLIYMYENLSNATLFTLDRDFNIYRTIKGKMINTLLPL